jgi:murein DD-endopeptidase MepM/ murein hydrolase activator NlpD
VEQAREQVQSKKAQLVAMQRDLNTAQTEMDAKSVEADALLSQLLSREAEYEALLQEAAGRQDDLMAELAKKEEEFDKAKEEEAYQQWLSTSVPDDVLPETDAPGGNYDSSGIYWVIPTKYLRVSSAFSDGRLHPILGYVRPHKGIDLAAYTGTPIYATRSGTVTAASTGVENGNYVFINHGDGYSSAYLHMHYYIVEAGEYVQAGQMIGVVGNTGLSKGSHLHFSIIHNGTYVNPAHYVEFY